MISLKKHANNESYNNTPYLQDFAKVKIVLKIKRLQDMKYREININADFEELHCDIFSNTFQNLLKLSAYHSN